MDAGFGQFRIRGVVVLDSGRPRCVPRVLGHLGVLGLHSFIGLSNTLHSWTLKHQVETVNIVFQLILYVINECETLKLRISHSWHRLLRISIIPPSMSSGMPCLWE